MLLSVLDGQGGAGLQPAGTTGPSIMANYSQAATISAGLDGSGNFVVDDLAGAATNQLAMSLDGSNLIIRDPSNIIGAGSGTMAIDDHTVSVPLALISGSIQISSGTTSATLDVDFSGGDPIVPGGLLFAGNVTDSTLDLVGGSFATDVYTVIGPHDGTIQLTLAGGSSGLITYTGLTPVVNTGTVADMVLDLPAGLNDAVLEDDGTAGNGMSLLHSNSGTFEDVTFANPTNSLTINSGSAQDTLETASLPDFTAGLTVGSSSAPFGSFSAFAPLDLGTGAGNLSVYAGTINLGGGTIETATAQTYSGSVVLGASTTLTANSGTAAGLVKFASTLAGGGFSLNIGNAGSSAITNAEFDGTASGLTTLAVSGTTKLGAGVSTAGGQNYAGAVTLAANVALADSTGGAIAFGSGIDAATAGTQGLTLSTTGLITLGAIGQVRALSALTVTTSTSMTISSSIKATGGISFSITDTAAPNDLTIQGPATVQSMLGSLVFDVGDDFTLGSGAWLRAATNLTINADSVVAGSDGDGSTISISGTITANSVSISGGAGSDTLEGSDIVNATLTGSEVGGYDGTAGAIDFNKIDILDGAGSGTLTGEYATATWNLGSTETYVDSSGRVLTLGGFSTLDSVGVNTFNVTSPTTATLNGGNVSTLEGSQIVNATVAPTYSGLFGTAGTITFTNILDIVGSGGGTLTGEVSGDTWTVNGTGGSYGNQIVNWLDFSGFAVIQAPTGGDIFNVTSPTNVALDGGTGSTLEGTQIVDAILTGSTASGFSGTAGTVTFTNIDVLTGSGSGTLTGESAAATWNLNNTNTYVDGAGHTLTFSGFAAVQAGDGGDTFKLADWYDPFGYGMTIDGGAGTDTLVLNYWWYYGRETLTGSTASGFSGSIGGAAFANIDVLNVGDSGNSESGALTGENTAAIWNLGATDTYVDGAGHTLTFSGFTTLQAGDGGDTFNVTAPTTIALNGAGSATLQGSQIGDVVLSPSAGAGTAGTVTFTDFAVLNGSGAGTLTGAYQAATWDLGASQSYFGNWGTITFGGFGTLQAGGGGDTFNVTSPTTITLDGAGNDTLQGSEIVNVTLTGASADGYSGTAGTVTFAGMEVVNASGVTTVVGQAFGHVPGKGNVVLRAVDPASGHLGVFSLSGPGQGFLQNLGTYWGMILIGTTRATTVVVSGAIDLEEIHAMSMVGAVYAPRADFVAVTGDELSSLMDFGGGLLSLTMHDSTALAAPGHDVTIAASDSIADAVSLRFHDANDLDVESSMPIALFQAASYFAHVSPGLPDYSAYGPSIASTNYIGSVIIAGNFQAVPDSAQAFISAGSVDPSTGVGIGRIQVGGDLVATQISSAGGIRSIVVGGTMDGSTVTAGGNIGPVWVGGDMQGSSGINVDSTAGNIASVHIRGNLDSSSVTISGVYGNSSTGNIGGVWIGGSMDDTSTISVDYGCVGNVHIGKDFDGSTITSVYGRSVGMVWVGGDFTDSASIKSAGGVNGLIVCGSMAGTSSLDAQGGNMGMVRIGGSLQDSTISAEIGNIGSVWIGGDMAGGSDIKSAGNGNIASVYVRGDLDGSTVEADDIGNIGPVTIGGSFDDNSAISSSYGRIQSVHVGRDFNDGTIAATYGAFVGDVWVGGNITDYTITSAGAIRSVTILGSCADDTYSTTQITAQTTIGSVYIGGSASYADITSGYRINSLCVKGLMQNGLVSLSEGGRIDSISVGQLDATTIDTRGVGAPNPPLGNGQDFPSTDSTIGRMVVHGLRNAGVWSYMTDGSDILSWQIGSLRFGHASAGGDGVLEYHAGAVVNLPSDITEDIY